MKVLIHNLGPSSKTKPILSVGIENTLMAICVSDIKKNIIKAPINVKR